MPPDRTFTKVLAAPERRVIPAPRPSMAELFAAHVQFVWRVARAQGVAADDVEDVTQEVFITAHRRMEDWNSDQASARTWLYGITIRTAANHRRRAHFRREQAGPAAERATDEDPNEAIDRARALARLYEVLGALEPEKRDVFLLYDLQEMPMKEVADAVGCPLKTAYSRLYAARAALAAAIGVDVGGQE